jgi:hypothetical protein
MAVSDGGRRGRLDFKASKPYDQFSKASKDIIKAVRHAPNRTTYGTSQGVTPARGR